jgi:signal peptidase I
MSIKNHKRLLFLFRFFLYAALVCYIVSYRYNFVFVMGGSMKEMYKHRDLSVVSYKYYENSDPEVGDVVCAEPTEDLVRKIKVVRVIKRIMAEEGDEVEIAGGNLIVNQKTNTLFAKGKTPLKMDKVKLQKDQYFIIGDNRDISAFYIVSKHQIVGKVLF